MKMDKKIRGIMMNTKEKKRIIGLVLLGLLLVIYFGVCFYFRNHFFPRTTLDGRGVGGYTAETLKKEMTEEIHSYTLTLEEREGKREEIRGADIALEPQWDGTIEQLLEKQPAFAWPIQLFFRHDLTGKTLVEYDEQLLKEKLMALDCMDEEQQVKPISATFSKYDPDSGFTVKPCVPGTTIDSDKLLSEVSSAVSGMAATLSVEEAGAYVEPKVKDDDEQLAKAIEKLNKYAGCSITFQIGDHTKLLDASEFGDWFKLNKKQKPVFRQDKVAEYVSSLAKTYNTCYSSKTLRTSYGTEVTIPDSHYGWKVDEEAEVRQIIADIKAGKAVTRDLNYSMTANSHGKHDYGDSYVEINLTAQHLFLYKDGKLVLDTDFVSGNVAKNNGTPTGAYGIYYTQKDAVLRGDDYETPVSYWMPFAGNVGMHDATWRGRFGGTIYKYGGSHGCVNLPLSAAKTIFETVDKNYPVLVYELPGTESTTGNDPAKAKAVSDLIDAVGEVTEDSENAITKAERAYEKLSATEKLSVNNYDKLVKARKALNRIQKEKQGVE